MSLNSHYQVLKEAIPYRHRPRTDLMSKSILKNRKIMNIVLSDVVGEEAVGKYVSIDGEWIDGRRIDALFVPFINSDRSLPPVIVEVQHTVDKAFLGRLTKYCNYIYDEYNKDPVVLTLCIKKINDNIVEKFNDSAVPYMKTLPSDFWAKEHYIITPSTINDYLEKRNDNCSIEDNTNNNNDDDKDNSNNNINDNHESDENIDNSNSNNNNNTDAESTTTQQLSGLAAISLVLTWQKQSLFEMQQYKTDPTVKLCYQVAKDVFDKEIKEHESNLDTCIKVATQTNKQFKRILEQVNEDGPNMRKKIKELSNNGILFTDTYMHIAREEGSGSNTNSSSSIDVLTPSLPSDATDMEFAMYWKDNYMKSHKRMNWAACFVEGQGKGFFASYNSHTSLKNTFNEKYKKQS